MNNCPKCHADNRTGARFCARCGAGLTTPPAPPAASSASAYTVKVCPSCSTPTPVGERRCRKCGYNFASSYAPRRSRAPRVAIVAIIALFALASFISVRMFLQRTAAEQVPGVGVDVDSALERAINATVQVLARDPAMSGGFSAGSGSVVDAEAGVILTNYHVISDPESGRGIDPNEEIFIAIAPPGSNQPPEILYVARVAQADARLDLAVLQITALDGGGSLPSDLGLTAIPLGDSTSVAIGDEIAVLGYPGLGGDTITLTRGTVSGFVDEWIKTDAEINHGNSGGVAIDAAGELIGVPTAGVSEEADAEHLPGKIGLVRPIDMAKELLERAGVE